MTDEVVKTDEVVSAPLIDTDVPAKPAPAADEQKTDTPAATDENAKPADTPEQQEVKEQSRRQRKLQRERDGRIAAETRAQIAEETLAKERAAKTPVSDEPQRNDVDPKTGEPFDYETYLRRVARWEARQERIEERNNESARAQSAKANEVPPEVARSWGEKETKFIKATPGYTEAVNDYVKTDIGKLSNSARQLLVESDVGPAVLHHLATNDEDHERIVALSPARQVIELGKLEDKLSAETPETAAAEAETPARKTTRAPAPITPVNQGRSTSTGFREGMSQSEFRAWAVKESGGKAKWIRN